MIQVWELEEGIDKLFFTIDQQPTETGVVHRLNYSTDEMWTEKGAECLTIEDDGNGYTIGGPDVTPVHLDYHTADMLAILLAYLKEDPITFKGTRVIKTLQ